LTPLPAHQASLNLLGSPFVIETADATTADDVRRLWRSFLQPHAETSADIVSAVGATPGERLLHVATAMNAAALLAAPELTIHAGVVAHDGVAVAMPADSGVGKSTLTAACLRVGFRYVSDEALCLRYPDGAVVPYPRPIALSAWSAAAIAAVGHGTPAGDELLYTAADLGAANQQEPARLGHIVVIERGAAGSSLTPARRPDAVALLLGLSFNHFRRPADAVRLIADVVSATSVWTLRYTDPLAAAGLLRSTLFG
jgi:hypothetical protein